MPKPLPLPRPRRPRLTIRRLMALVAVVGIVISGSLMVRRRAEALRQVEHFRAVAILSELTYEKDLTSRRIEGWPQTWASREGSRRTMEHYRWLVSEYERAARQPWMSVGPYEGGYSTSVNLSEAPAEPKGPE